MLCFYVAFYPQLSNHLFEELAMDVYDEVDRRELDAGKYSQLLAEYKLYQNDGNPEV